MGCGRGRPRRKTLDGSEAEEESRYEREFQELNLVGRGGFGAVYKARNRLDGSLYAVKKTQFQLRPKEAFTMRGKSDAFLSEVALLSKMDHPHVVRYYAAWLEEEWTTVKDEMCDGIFNSCMGSENSDEEVMPVGTPCYCITVYMQMALYEDDSLMARIENQARIVEPGCNLTVLVQILQGLSYVHSMSIIHRDIKPSNIFFNQDGIIKIGDFGLSIVDTNSRSRCNSVDSVDVSSLQDAHLANSSLHLPPSHSPGTKALAGVGTAVYASPEQLGGRSCTFASDIFSVGVIMFELYHAPFYSCSERYKTISKVRSGDIPESIEEEFPREVALMKWCLHPDPARRPTCEQLLAPENSVAWLHHQFGGSILTTSPLCGSSTPSSNTPSASCKTSPSLSPAVDPKMHSDFGGVTTLLNYLDYNLMPVNTSPRLQPQSRTQPPSPLLARTGPPKLDLSASAVRQAQTQKIYRSLEHEGLVTLLLERDEQIEALHARIAKMEDCILACRVPMDDFGGPMTSPGLDILNL
jgi:serine/threonine protein kinase